MAEKLEMKTKDLTQENVEKIAELFPSCVVEAKKGDKTVRSIDFDALRQELSDVIVDGPVERYQFTWPDKSKARLLANSPTTMTLRPSTNPDGTINENDSVDFWNTKNIYIEGDNLDVLKILRETYLGKIKMIYIDPPYNTGSDFLYDDNFAFSSEDYKVISGDFNDEGERLEPNNTGNGRFHTDWLNMMYPRLRIAKDLLKEDGVIYISIDDNELCNVKKICDDIFGEYNFVGNIVWKSKSGGANDSKNIAIDHEYILAYARNIEKVHLSGVEYDESLLKLYTGRDEYYTIRGPYRPMLLMQKGLSYSESLTYPIEAPDGSILVPDEGGAIWRWAEKVFLKRKDLGFIEFQKVNGKYKVYTKQYLNVDYDGNPIERTELFRSVILDIDGRIGTRHLQDLFDTKVFTNPKPVELIKTLANITASKDDLVLDFFAGSSTTAESILEMNDEKSTTCRYILVQLRETIDEKSISSSGAGKIKSNAIEFLDKYKLDHKITELGKERIRRVGKHLQNKNQQKTIDCLGNKLDVGFRVLKLDSSNMKDIYYSPDEVQKTLIDDYVDNVKSDRYPIDLLFQSMLEVDVELSASIKPEKIDGKVVFNVDDNYLVACYDNDVTESVVTEIAKRKPAIAVFRDSSMDSDSTFTNYDQIFKRYSPTTDVRIL